VLPSVQDIQGDADLDQIQVQDWDKEVKEDEATSEEQELTKVH
jgi:hypothetical protein